MSDRYEWRRIFGRWTLFEAGIGIGDVYLTKGADKDDVFRLRVWPPYRLQGGHERYVLAPAGEEAAKEAFVEMLKGARREGATDGY